MSKTHPYEYQSICQDCHEAFSFRRAQPLSEGQLGDNLSKARQYCDSCLQKRYVHHYGDNSRKRRELVYTDRCGYRHIRVNGGLFLAEHRVIMAQMLGRPLMKGESVHHKNGNREDNRPENLELWVKPQQLAGQRAKDIICPHCGKPYLSS